jgi:hypothetical protein
VDKVTSILRGQTTLMAHGDQEMPVWGPVFWRMSQGHEEQVQMRIGNLTTTWSRCRRNRPRF